MWGGTQEGNNLLISRLLSSHYGRYIAHVDKMTGLIVEHYLQDFELHDFLGTRWILVAIKRVNLEAESRFRALELLLLLLDLMPNENLFKTHWS